MIDLYIVISGDWVDGIECDICVEGVYTSYAEAFIRFQDVKRKRDLCRIEHWRSNEMNDVYYYFIKRIVP